MEKPLVGKRIGDRYEILEWIGGGGQGDVYRALDHVLAQEVAFKVLHEEMDSEEFKKRFDREAKVLAKFRKHSNILTIYDLFSRDGITAIITEFIHGKTLFKFLETDHTKTYPEVFLMIVHEVCKALQAPHDEGFVHRDIKPENIMFERGGRVVLMDFGLSKDLSRSSNVTQDHVVGTLGYIAPEQFSPNQPISPAVDVFALGALLYVVCTGYNPFTFKTSSVQEVIGRLITCDYLPPEKLASIDSRLCLMIERCLKKEPSERFQTAGELLEHLSAYLNQYGIYDVPRELKRYDENPEAYTDAFTERLIERIAGFVKLPEQKNEVKVLIERILSIRRIQEMRLKSMVDPRLFETLFKTDKVDFFNEGYSKFEQTQTLHDAKVRRLENIPDTRNLSDQAVAVVTAPPKPKRRWMLPIILGILFGEVMTLGVWKFQDRIGLKFEQWFGWKIAFKQTVEKVEPPIVSTLKPTQTDPTANGTVTPPPIPSPPKDRVESDPKLSTSSPSSSAEVPEKKPSPQPEKDVPKPTPRETSLKNATTSLKGDASSPKKPSSDSKSKLTPLKDKSSDVVKENLKNKPKELKRLALPAKKTHVLVRFDTSQTKRSTKILLLDVKMVIDNKPIALKEIEKRRVSGHMVWLVPIASGKHTVSFITRSGEKSTQKTIDFPDNGVTTIRIEDFFPD